MMDFKVDPCVDFYNYSCNGWANTHTLPPDSDRDIHFITLIEDRNLQILKKIVTNTSHPLLSGFYEACMDLTTIEKNGFTPLVPSFLQVQDLLQNYSPGNLMSAVAFSTTIGVETIFSFTVDLDAENPGLNVVQLGQGGFSLPDRSYYNDTDVMKEYLAHVTTMFQFIGDPNPEASAADVLAIEYDLASASLPSDELNDPFKTYNPFNLQNLTTFTGLSWKDFFVFAGIPSSGNIVIDVPSFFSSVRSIADKYNTSLSSYFTWRVLTTFAPNLSKKFVDEDFAFFDKYLSGQEQQSLRNKTCIQSTRSLGELIGKYYEETQFSPSDRKANIEILQFVEDAMGSDISGIDWMDDATKSRALQKLSQVSYLIGGPSRPRKYRDVVIGSLYVDNVLEVAMDAFNRSVAMVGKPVNPGQWFMNADEVNAYYDPTRNQMVFPAGQLQSPYYDPTFPLSYNYAGTGGTMGHELTHGMWLGVDSLVITLF
eukprot:TRINITY_DN9479_c0_g2_i3.p1 TRINITY_DN9479_c0_g2~~TRINITY_DN9479_c0_g2_i3.p1  ORF type:complete len:483 (+),score=74.04 TRINITY_DN9479_c0_g2_i3:196-1644(+)